MENLLSRMFFNSKAYNKHMTLEYFGQLNFNIKLCFCHPDDRDRFTKEYNNLNR